MKSKWIKTTDFKWKQDEKFDCFIFMDNKVVKAKYDGGFTFNYGVCGRLHPTHVMKIKTPKPPIENNS